ncbi:hypothetical protein PAEPH01_1362 [Pancytospora epiphaga]|nr:hypothetical protein PAEPH01_1362 [Pancytospora epiphaga]
MGLYFYLWGFILEVLALSVPPTDLEKLRQLRTNLDMILGNEELISLSRAENPSIEPDTRDTRTFERILNDLETSKNMLDEDAESMDKHNMFDGSRKAVSELQNFLASNYPDELYDGLGDIRILMEGTLKLYGELLDGP